MDSQVKVAIITGIVALLVAVIQGPAIIDKLSPPEPNTPPVINSLDPNRPSPQFAEMIIEWKAIATDPDPNDDLLYRFLRSGPSTGYKFVEVQGWSNDNSWTWTTTDADVGNNQIEVQVRDGNHAKETGSDNSNIADYVIEDNTVISPPKNHENGSVSTGLSGSLTGLYRFVNPQIGDHYLNTYPTIPAGYQPDGPNNQNTPIGYIAVSQLPGTDPLYRFLDSRTGNHYLNTYPTIPAGYQPDGPNNQNTPIGYIAVSLLPGTNPLYRFYNSINNDHYLNTLSTIPTGYQPDGPDNQNIPIGYIWRNLQGT